MHLNFYFFFKFSIQVNKKLRKNNKIVVPIKHSKEAKKFKYSFKIQIGQLELGEFCSS
jgi:hypothetical protein